MSCQYTHILTAKIKNSDNKVDKKILNLSFTAGGNVKWYNHSGKQFSTFIKN